VLGLSVLVAAVVVLLWPGPLLELGLGALVLACLVVLGAVVWRRQMH
jgi:hypothetical protein